MRSQCSFLLIQTAKKKNTAPVKVRMNTYNSANAVAKQRENWRYVLLNASVFRTIVYTIIQMANIFNIRFYRDNG